MKYINKTGASPEEGHHAATCNIWAGAERSVCAQPGGEMVKGGFSCCLQQHCRWLYRRQNQTLLRGAKIEWEAMVTSCNKGSSH